MQWSMSLGYHTNVAIFFFRKFVTLASLKVPSGCSSLFHLPPPLRSLLSPDRLRLLLLRLRVHRHPGERLRLVLPGDGGVAEVAERNGQVGETRRGRKEMRKKCAKKVIRIFE